MDFGFRIYCRRLPYRAFAAFLWITVVLFTVLGLCGCSQKIKRAVGADTPVPNENAIKVHKPLEMPPHVQLEEIDAAEKK